jgi:hypothetical protein
LPAEIRHIVFCSSEIAAAVREYRRQVHRPLPVGALRRLDLTGSKGGGVRLAIEIAPEGGGPPETAELGSAELADALIQYCEAHHIPLPLAGTKGLQRFGDNLLLIVTTNLRGAGWPLSASLSLHPAIPTAAPEPEKLAEPAVSPA